MKTVVDRYKRLAVLLIAAAGLAAAAWLIAERAIDQTVDVVGRSAAVDWAEFLSAALPDLENVLARGPTSAATADFVAKTRNVGNVFRYRIFDLSGTVLLDSKGGADTGEGADNALQAMRASETGLVSMVRGTGDGVDLPAYYAQAYVPLRIDGRIRGTIAVDIDQTVRVARISTLFIWSGLGIAALSTGAILMLLLSNVRKSRRARTALTFVSRHDDLTRLSNRRAFDATVDGRIADAVPFDLLSIDLDHFKVVNDSRGHAVGDALLILVAARLLEVAGPRGLASRLGGDEFAIYYPIDAGLETGDHLANRLVAALSRSFLIDGAETVIGASVGIASSPSDGATARALHKAADLAVNAAKQSGGGRVVRFAPSMEQQVQRRALLEDRVRSAVENQEFAIHYQPLLDATKLGGFEALLRLWDKDGEPIPPPVFIPVAEQMGLIGRIGADTLRAACRTASLWPDDLRVAVNLSALQFESGDLGDLVRDALSDSGLPAHRLELEITESVLIADADSVLRQLQGLRALGVSIALDDFGTGYSSLSYLWMFPFDRLKVDRSFIGRLSGERAKAKDVLASILALGRALEMSITAEGVETVAQSVILRSMNVDTMQGYLYGRPVPETELATTILRLRGGFHATSPNDPAAAARAAPRVRQPPAPIQMPKLGSR